MGQTLSHGVYLPAEGERNCYSGLASNWNLLDTALGDIDGKASATHTHGSITNDGKLATANRVLVTDGNKVISLSGVTDTELSYLSGVTSSIQTQLNAKAADSDVVHTTGNETIAGDKTFSGTGNQFNTQTVTYLNTITLGVKPTNNQLIQNYHNASNSEYISYIRTAVYDIGDTRIELGVRNKFSNGALDPNGSQINNFFGVGLNNSGVPYLLWNCGVRGDVYPYGTRSLGTSSYKWKTLNGINPGALSLPDFSAEFDVSGQIVPPTGENQISINWGRNTFTPSVNGWLSVRIHKATSIEIYRSIRSSYCAASRVESADDICVCSPVVAGVEYTIKIQATQFSSDYDHFRLSPCLGNV